MILKILSLTLLLTLVQETVGASPSLEKPTLLSVPVGSQENSDSNVST